MRFAIMGAGGIGAYYGACLAKAGHDVCFIARGKHLEEMQNNGLQIEEFDGPGFRIDPVQATDDPETLGPVDTVLFCVKMYDTVSAAELCKPMVGPETVVLTLQNGVESAGMIDGILGHGRTLGGAAFVAGSIVRPGVVRRNNQITRIEFGEMTGAISPRAEALAQILNDAGIPATLSDDVEAMLWAKFALMTSNSVLTSLSRVDTGIIKADPVMRDVYCRAMREVIAVGKAKGVKLADDLEEKTLAWLDGSAPIMASLANDLIAGRRLEVEWLSGAIHRFGQEMDVPTPIHTTVYAALRPHVNGKPA